MVKMLSATAVARIPGDTTFTIAELIGPVEANRHSSAATMAGQYTAGRGDDSASKVSGAASRVAPPDTHKYACREQRRPPSPNQPPPSAPRKPVATTTAPHCTVATALDMPRARTPNPGVHDP